MPIMAVFGRCLLEMFCYAFGWATLWNNRFACIPTVQRVEWCECLCLTVDRYAVRLERFHTCPVNIVIHMHQILYAIYQNVVVATTNRKVHCYNFGVVTFMNWCFNFSQFYRAITVVEHEPSPRLPTVSIHPALVWMSFRLSGDLDLLPLSKYGPSMEWLLAGTPTH